MLQSGDDEYRPLYKMLTHAISGIDTVGKHLGLNLLSPNAMESLTSGRKVKFVDWLRMEHKRRIRRSAFLLPDIFGEPGWDMLLDLAAAQLDGRVISVTSACLSSGVPQSTALRWLVMLEAEGLVERHPDETDGRRTVVRPTAKALNGLKDYFSAWIAD